MLCSQVGLVDVPEITLVQPEGFGLRFIEREPQIMIVTLPNFFIYTALNLSSSNSYIGHLSSRVTWIPYLVWKAHGICYHHISQ